MGATILVPVDTSYESGDWIRPVFDEALYLAQRADAEIHVVTVVPENLFKGFYPDVYSGDVVRTASDRLDAIVRANLPPNLKATAHVAEGGICTEILKQAKALEADVIVMASHGPLMRDYVMGSNAAHVALHAPCSVFVVRNA